MPQDPRFHLSPCLEIPFSDHIAAPKIIFQQPVRHSQPVSLSISVTCSDPLAED